MPAPSTLHELLADLFRTRPTLAADLLERSLAVKVPRFGGEARVKSAEYTELKPPEYQADVVVLLGPEASPVLAIIVEVQLSADAGKRYSWPMYVAGLRARHLCPTCVLVVTVDERVARWARKPIKLGPGCTFTPLVVGPDAVPLVATTEEAEREPELTLLSVMAHGRREDAVSLSMIPAVARAVLALEAEKKKSGDKTMLHLDVIWHSLGSVAARALEELMSSEMYEPKSPFARQYFAEKAAARAAGQAEGKAEGRADSLLLFLRARGTAVTSTAEARIRQCTDLAELDRWMTRAFASDLADADALFE